MASSSAEELGAQMRAALAMADLHQNDGNTDCNHCGADNAKRCSRCRDARFCNRTCQRAAWNQHKLVCVPPEKDVATASADADAVSRADRLVRRDGDPKAHAVYSTLASIMSSGTQLCDTCGQHVQTMTKCVGTGSYHTF